MLIQLDWDTLLQACHEHEPEQDLGHAAREALEWLRELNIMDREWITSQNDFYNSGSLLFYGAEPGDRFEAMLHKLRTSDQYSYNEQLTP